jgi:hypothetical protein
MNVISYLRDCLELEELDWRKLQAEEIKAMLFRSPQPKILQDEIKHIQSSVVIEVNDEDDANDGDEELADLKTACDNLDAAIGRIGENDDPRREDGIQSRDGRRGGPRKPDGPVDIPCTHEAIYNHSWRQPHVKSVWITLASTVNKDGNLGYPASAEDVSRFGARAGKVFLRPLPLVLQECLLVW